MAGGAGRGLGRVAPDAVAEVLAGRPELGPASGASLRSLLGSGHGVAVVDGTWAGAGPGREPWVGQAALLDAAVTAWHDAGHRVALDATSDAARRRWSALCGVTDHPSGTSPTVLIVDRADRRPTPELHRLLDRAAAQATKVILVVGGTLPARRRALSEGLEQGATALGRLAPIGPEELRGRSGAVWERGIDRWAGSGCRATLVGLGPAEVAELNHRVRQQLAPGRTDETVVAGRPWACGDPVVSLGARSGRPVGHTGVVASTSIGDRGMAVAWSDGGTETIPSHRGRTIGPGWATTPAIARRGTSELLVVGRALDLGRSIDRVIGTIDRGAAGGVRDRSASRGATGIGTDATMERVRPERRRPPPQIERDGLGL